VIIADRVWGDGKVKVAMEPTGDEASMAKG
jgi:hypothetical protein